MGAFIGIVVVAALIGAVVWNHRNANEAMQGIEFLTPEPPEVVVATIRAAYCVGAKAKIKSAVWRVTVTATGRGSFRFETKIGDIGQISVQADGAGSVVEAHTDELYVGSHPSAHFKKGWLNLGARLTHTTYKVLGIAPYAAKMRKFQLGIERRVAKELGRQPWRTGPLETDEAPVTAVLPPVAEGAPVAERPPMLDEALPVVVTASAPPMVVETSPVADQGPGWYPDPQGRADLRWFDGNQWTVHEHPRPAAAPAPVTVVTHPSFHAPTPTPTPTPTPAPGPPAPRLPAGYFAQILAQASFPSTTENLLATAEQVAELFLLRGRQFIQRNGSVTDLVRFDDTYAQPGYDITAWPQEILDGIVAWNPRSAAHLRDLPDRVRVHLLASVDEPGGFFSQPPSVPLPLRRA